MGETAWKDAKMGAKQGNSESGKYTPFLLFLINGGLPIGQTHIMHWPHGGLPPHRRAWPYWPAGKTSGPPKSIWKNGPKMAISQAYLNEISISRPANLLAIPLHWPFVPKSCLTTLKSARSKNTFSSETQKMPLFGHLGPPKGASRWPKPQETPDT